VAGGTGQLPVLAMQGEIGFTIVVEARQAPAFLIVAGLAFFAVAALVLIVGLVAGVTGFPGFPVLDRIDVTGFATDLPVLATQREISVFLVVKF